jgi:hypothetical protein
MNNLACLARSAVLITTMLVVLINIFFLAAAYKGYDAFRKFLLAREKAGWAKDYLLKESFVHSVNYVRAQVVCTIATVPTPQAAPLLEQPLIGQVEPPTSGLYQAEISEFAITKKIDNTVFSPGSHVSSVLSVQFTPANECEAALTAGMGGAGLLILRGSRTNSSKDFYAIEQGVFNSRATVGEPNCFWVEQRTSDQFLIMGTWTDSMFEGEWLSCTGMRGRYSAVRADAMLMADSHEIQIKEEALSPPDESTV